MDIRTHFSRQQGNSTPSSRTPLPEVDRQSTSKTTGAGKMSGASGFVEPALAGAASFEDHGGQAYGTTEDMQPLGERPNTKVKQRVKQDAPRKGALGRTFAAVNSDAQETPDSTPGPAIEYEPASQPVPLIVDDDNDGDYAPKVKKTTGVKKERAQRAPKPKRESVTPAASAPPSARVSSSGAIKKASKPPTVRLTAEQKKLQRVTEAAKSRAVQVGKPDLAAAVQEIYENSLTDSTLTGLLGAILAQKATAEQTKQFQEYVKRAKQKLKDMAKKEEDSAGVNAKTEPLANGESRAHLASIPLQSPSQPKVSTSTPAFTAVNASAPIPSTELTEQNVAKKNKETSHSPAMISPRKGRTDGNASDSSLTELESDGESKYMPEQPRSSARPPSAPTAGRKDHAAERGTLAAPKVAGSKRPSAEIDTADDEADRILHHKKQKLRERIIRDPDHQFEESHVRPSLEPPSSARLRGKAAPGVVPPPVKLNLKTNGARHLMRPSDDSDSSLSDVEEPASPALLEGGPPLKRAKTKTSPEKKRLTASGQVINPGERSRENGMNANDNDDDSESENNDFCTACGGSGYLLCCDGCDRAFHFKCVEPPLEPESKELDEPWYCAVCQDHVRGSQGEKKIRGLFAPIINDIKRKVTSVFELPVEIRDHYQGTGVDAEGNFIEPVAARNTRASGRTGFVEVPDYKRTKDAKGSSIYCFSCLRSSEGRRELTACDACGTYWHLDCLDPPASNPPFRKNLDGKIISEWLCPLHVDHDLRQVDVGMLNPHKRRRTVHLRKPRNPVLKEPALTRGLPNNGIIEVVNDESDSESEFYDEDFNDKNVTYKMPASGIKLDFIDRVKRGRVQGLHTKVVQQQLYADAVKAVSSVKTAVAAQSGRPGALDRPAFADRDFGDQQVALQLAQFAQGEGNADLEFGGSRVESLVGTLIAEAPAEVAVAMGGKKGSAANGDVEMGDVNGVGDSDSSKLSSPGSTGVADARERKQLLALQELIRRRLEGK